MEDGCFLSVCHCAYPALGAFGPAKVRRKSRSSAWCVHLETPEVQRRAGGMTCVWPAGCEEVRGLAERVHVELSTAVSA
jgi:hypothetical protein